MDELESNHKRASFLACISSLLGCDQCSTSTQLEGRKCDTHTYRARVFIIALRGHTDRNVSACRRPPNSKTSPGYTEPSQSGYSSGIGILR